MKTNKTIVNQFFKAAHLLRMKYGLTRDDIKHAEAFFPNSVCNHSFELELLRYLSNVDLLNQHSLKYCINGFDSVNYLKIYPELLCLTEIAFLHYLKHGRHELRSPLPEKSIREILYKMPTVSAIVPNYNHSQFLIQRLDSIRNQTLPVDEIIILDDCSTDSSRELIDAFAFNNKNLNINVVYNDVNSGSVFKQWKKGIELSQSDLIWICESDDYCDTEFLECLLPNFLDQSVNIGFGNIQIVDIKGTINPFLDSYRRSACPSLDWSMRWEHFTNDLLAHGFCIKNIIPNSGGAIIRKQLLSDEIWAAAFSYKACADWFLYLVFAGCGKIVYEPRSLAFFRHHGTNTSVKLTRELQFFTEHVAIWDHIQRYYGPSSTNSAIRYLLHISDSYDQVIEIAPSAKPAIQALLKRIKPVRKSVPTVAIAIQSLTVGGGEIFPITLAEYLYKQRLANVVIIVVSSQEININVRSRISFGIPVIFLSNYAPTEYEGLMTSLGVDVLNTHSSHCDFTILPHISRSRAVVCSLHGGYDAYDSLPSQHLDLLDQLVSCFTYLTSKNKIFANTSALKFKRFFRVRNAVPAGPALIPASETATLNKITRLKESGVFIFMFAARGIEDKGWSVVIQAFVRLTQLNPCYEGKAALILCGSSPYVDSLAQQYAAFSSIIFAGSVSSTSPYLSYADCFVFPTRFPGESLPLVLIEALNSGVPSIATDIGEIAQFLATSMPDESIGLLISFLHDTEEMIDDTSSKMLALISDTCLCDRLKNNTLKRMSEYSICSVANAYLMIYRSAIASHTYVEVKCSGTAVASQQESRAYQDNLHESLAYSYLNSVRWDRLSQDDKDHIRRCISSSEFGDIPYQIVDANKLTASLMSRISESTLISLISSLNGAQGPLASHSKGVQDAIKSIGVIRLLGFGVDGKHPSDIMNHIFFVEPLNCFYYQIPKNASTFLKKLFWCITHEQEMFPDNLDPHFCLDPVSIFNLDLDQLHFARRFSVIRDPIERFMSACLNKLASNEVHERESDLIKELHSRSGITIEEIVLSDISKELIASDSHFLPQVTFLGGAPLDKYMLMHTVNQEIAELAFACGKPIGEHVQRMLLSSARSNASPWATSSGLPPGEAARIPIDTLKKCSKFPSLQDFCSFPIVSRILSLYEGDWALWSNLSGVNSPFEPLQ